MVQPFNGERRPGDNPPPFDISASADRVVALLNANQGVEAMRLLEQQREQQPQTIQESLDRMVAARGGESLTRMRGEMARVPDQAGEPDLVRAAASLDRLNTAVGPPRFPTETDVAALTATQRYDVYASIIETRGNDAARQSLRDGDRVILGMRQENSTVDSATRDPPGQVAADNPNTPVDESRRGTGVYDDRVVVLGRRTPAGGGDPEVWQFNHSNTEPTAQYDAHAQPRDRQEPYTHVQRRRVEGEDVNGDGVRDLGRLREGTVEMLATTHPRPGGGRDDFSLRPTPEAVAAAPQGVQRDTNADGRFDGNDVNGLQPLNNTFKIPRGSLGNTDSAGCQTIRGADYDGFVDAVRGNPGQTRWQYVLTETAPAPVQVQGQQQGQPEAPPQEGPPRERQAPIEQQLAPPAPPANERHAALPRDSLMERIEQTLDRSGNAQGLTQEQRENVLAASYDALSRLPRVDHIGVYNGNVVGTYAPSGLGTEPMHNSAVDIARARDMPAEQSLAAVERGQQERLAAAQHVEEQRGHGARAA
jgi:hypothetical protein